MATRKFTLLLQGAVVQNLSVHGRGLGGAMFARVASAVA